MPPERRRFGYLPVNVPRAHLGPCPAVWPQRRCKCCPRWTQSLHARPRPLTHLRTGTGIWRPQNWRVFHECEETVCTAFTLVGAASGETPWSWEHQLCPGLRTDGCVLLADAGGGGHGDGGAWPASAAPAGGPARRREGRAGGSRQPPRFRLCSPGAGSEDPAPVRPGAFVFLGVMSPLHGLVLDSLVR